MKVSPKQYAITLYELTDGKSEKEILDILKNFSILLKKRNYLSKTDLILEEFNKVWNTEKNIVNAKIVSARPLDSDLKQNIINYISSASKAKEVFLEEDIDKNILGGVIIKYNDKVIDSCLKTRVNILGKSLEK